MPPVGNRFVVYLRVSTARQGQSGLGLEAQREAVQRFVAARRGKITAEFTEIETGKRDKRPQLQSALARCKRTGATLIIAKLDRLTRNARFLLSIIESNVPVAFCDLPHIPAGANGKFLLTQFAAVAELEAGMISERTKAALAAAKARGTKLGGRRVGSADIRQYQASGVAVASQMARERATRFAEEHRDAIEEMQAEGLSLTAMAAKLNADGVPTRRGGKWTSTAVRRMIARLA